MRSAVAYIRVSKPKQGRSGLGLEAQQAAIKAFCAQHGYKIEAEYREIETGKGADALERRPELAAAMKFAQKLGKGSKARAALASTVPDRNLAPGPTPALAYSRAKM